MGAEAFALTDHESVAECRQAASSLQHDVRSPLAVVCLAAECLCYVADLDLATRRRYAASITVQATRIGRLLEYYGAACEALPEEKLSPVDLLEALEGAAGRLEEMTRLLGINLRLGPAPVGLKLWAPVERLRLLLVAGLEAACELTGEGGQVVATVTERGERMEVGIRVQPYAPVEESGQSLVWQALRALLEGEPELTGLRDGELRLGLPLRWPREQSSGAEATR
jgi:signal transduction histidine kinase